MERSATSSAIINQLDRTLPAHSTRLKLVREKNEVAFTRDLARAAEMLSLTNADQAIDNVYHALETAAPKANAEEISPHSTAEQVVL